MSNTTEAQREIREHQLKSDMVLLVDLVTEHSHNVQLVTYDDLLNEFTLKAAKTPVLTAEDIQDAVEKKPMSLLQKQVTGEADDGPEAKERRKVMSRREMFSNLFSGDLSVQDLKTEPEKEPVPDREITPEYFDQVLSAVLGGDFRVEELVAWDKQRYYHFTPLLSCSYARFMSAKNNPYELILDTVRENSRVYPRPVGVYWFENSPFNLDPKVIEKILDQISKDPNAQDIRVTVTDMDSVYLYSNKYLEDNYADFLAQEMDQGGGESL